MPAIENIKPLPSNYQELVSAFNQHIVQGERYVTDFENRHFNGIQEEAVIYCLRRALDLAKGCLATATAELTDSLTTLSRAILETLFWARYVTLSKEKAQEFVDSPMQEMKRAARKNINAGYARVVEINTNNDKSDEILNSPIMKDIPRRGTIESAAVAGGLGRVYTNLYGFLSMIAHGKAFGLREKSETEDELFASISAALGAFECIEIITYEWITYRKQTPKETLTRLLGF